MNLLNAFRTLLDRRARFRMLLNCTAASAAFAQCMSFEENPRTGSKTLRMSRLLSTRSMYLLALFDMTIASRKSLIAIWQ